MDRNLISKIAQEAHTMGRIYEKVLSPVNPAIEFDNVERMIDRMLKANSVFQPAVEADAESRCPKCSEPEPVFCCENCGHKWSRTT